MKIQHYGTLLSWQIKWLSLSLFRSKLVLSETMSEQNPKSPYRRMVGHHMPTAPSSLGVVMKTEDLLEAAKSNIHKLRGKEDKSERKVHVIFNELCSILVPINAHCSQLKVLTCAACIITAYIHCTLDQQKALFWPICCSNRVSVMCLCVCVCACVYVCVCTCCMFMCVCVCVCVYMYVHLYMSTEMCFPPGDLVTQLDPPTPLNHQKLMRKQRVALRSVWEELATPTSCVFTCAHVCRM